MRLTLGPRTYDLTARALVMASIERVDSGQAVDEGADIVEVGQVDVAYTAGAAVCVALPGGRGLDRALAAGAALVWLDASVASAIYGACAEAGVSVIVPSTDAGSAERAGVPADRIVVVDGDPAGCYPVLVDVTGAASPTAATAAAVVLGAGIVRTHDVRGARRICDVLAAVMDAR